MSMTIRVEGLRETEARLAEIGVKIRPGLLASTRAGAKVLQAAIGAEAPVGKTHNLQNSVRLKSSHTKRTGFTGHVVGPFGPGSQHRGLVIFGHNIKGHAHSVLGVRLDTKRFGHQRVGGKTRTASNHFVSRGRDRVEAAAMAATEVAAARAIERAVKRVAR